MDMDQVMQIVKEVNIAQIIILLVSMWFFYSRLDKKIDKVDSKIDKVRDELKGEIHLLSGKVEDIDRRLCRIEGSLASQGHCLFTKSQADHKAL